MEDTKKTHEVVAAVIVDGDKVLAARRGSGSFKGGWEFPGGKMEQGETREQALIREIKEELNADIIVGELITTVNYEYPKNHLIMHCYFCELSNSNIELLEHSEMKWITDKDMDNLDWLPADVEVVEMVKQIKYGE